MGTRIEDEIKQTKFASELEKLAVNLAFTSNQFNAQFNRDLKPFGISSQQFNILRILRGQFPNSAPLKLITERMIDRMSNTSRLVEKLRQKGLVERHVNIQNRREVAIIITPKGLDLIKEASEAAEKVRERLLERISEDEAAMVNSVLDKMRE